MWGGAVGAAPDYRVIVASLDRTETDRNDDERRKPVQLLEFADVRVGMKILEIGAGSGALAADLLTELERLGRAPKRYLILELSPDLRERSRDTLAARAPRLLERVAWLEQFPELPAAIRMAVDGR